MKPSFALLVPTFNGGPLLEETLRSCLAAPLDPSKTRVLVCDNGSTDGSYEAAYRFAEESHGLIQVLRNPENLGRIGNWNRCLEVAEAMGARFATFLMVGDKWLPGADPLAIIAEMERSGARMALAPYHIVDASGRFLRLARNFIRGSRRAIQAQPFIDHALQEGALCFGPLQANIYRLEVPSPLRFDPADPTHTDQRATILYLGRDTQTLQLWDQAIFAWKAHAGRFHMGMDVSQRASDDSEMIRNLAELRGLRVDFQRIYANLFLLAAREWAMKPGGMRKIWEVARYFRGCPEGLSVAMVMRQAFRRVFLRRFLT